MTDETPETVNAPPPRKRGGWPKGRPRQKPLAPEVVAAAVKRAVERPSMLSKMKSRPNWSDDTADNVGDEGVDRLHIPREIVDHLAREGIALQWATRAVRGMEAPQEMAKYIKGGWTPVHQSDFDGLLDGMFLPKGLDAEIAVDDAILVARPISIQIRAKQREKAMAREPIAIKEAALGRGINVPGGDHPSATMQNRINKTVERIEIPE